MTRTIIIVWLLFCLVLAASVKADTKNEWYAGELVWDVVGGAGQAFGVLYLERFVFHNYWASVGCMLVLSVTKEWLDQLYHEHYGCDHWFFDGLNGGNFRDVVVRFGISVPLSFPLRRYR